MKRLLSLWIGLLTLLVSANALAFTVPPAPTDGFLLDQAGVLSGSDASGIRSKLTQINASTHNEIAVLVINSLDGESIEDAAHQVFNTWGVGKKGKDNGVLLMVSISDQKMRIETGKGVEGELTDLQSNDILNKKIRPHFKQKDYAGGINEGVTAISSTLESRHGQPTSPVASSGSSGSEHGWLFWFLVIAVIIIVVLVVMALSRSGGGGWGGGSSYGGSWSSGGGSSGGDSFGGGDSGGGGSSSDW